MIGNSLICSKLILGNSHLYQANGILKIIQKLHSTILKSSVENSCQFMTFGSYLMLKFKILSLQILNSFLSNLNFFLINFFWVMFKFKLCNLLNLLKFCSYVSKIKWNSGPSFARERNIIRHHQIYVAFLLQCLYLLL